MMSPTFFPAKKQEHVLYIDSDFTKEEVARENVIARMVMQQGFLMCKRCGRVERELDEPCGPRHKRRSRMIVGITGKKGSGKDTLGAAIVKKYGCTQIAFADLLREECCQIYHCNMEVLTDRETKETPNPGLDGKSPRQIMQEYGTLRRKENPNYWVDAVHKHMLINSCENFVVTDVRFPSEVAMIESMPASVMIHVERPDAPEDCDTHITETAIDDRMYLNKVINVEKCPQGMLLQAMQYLPFVSDLDER